MEEWLHRFRQAASEREGLRYPQSLRQLALEYATVAANRGGSRREIAASLGLPEVTRSRWQKECGRWRLRCTRSSSSHRRVETRGRTGVEAALGRLGGGAQRRRVGNRAEVSRVIGLSRGRVFAHAAPADLRKGFDGLAALVRDQLGSDATSGDLYLFGSRDRLRAKVCGGMARGFASMPSAWSKVVSRHSGTA